MKDMYFNIYYINLSKVYELAMMKNNKIIKTLESEFIDSNERIQEGKYSFNVGVKDYVGIDLGESSNYKKYQSKKIAETLEVKTTKSILLRKIMDLCVNFTKSTSLKKGDLLYINDVELSLINEDMIRAVKILKSNAIKGVTYEGLDLDNLVNSVLKDYFYLLSGKIYDKDILIKIPLTNNDDFENLYTIDDLLIGKVSIIGIYRGQIHLNQLKNTFSVLNDTSQHEENIQKNYSYEESNVSFERDNDSDDVIDNDVNYDFIDVISIIQNVNTKKKNIQSPEKKVFFNKVIDFIRGKS